MADSGATRLYAKPLAPNDNSKNQIYFGPGIESLNIFPHSDPELDTQEGRQILKAKIDFAWIDGEGIFPAPMAQFIFYPQYPEVRMGSLLKGCQSPPSAIIGKRAEGRVLFLGITNDKRILAYAAAATSGVAQEFEQIKPQLLVSGVFFEIPISPRGIERSNRDRLLSALEIIATKGWIHAVRMKKDGSRVPCSGPNCGGCTLEAELGIKPNSLAAPDYLGWEIKQYSKSPITLMTPDPTGGYFEVHGVDKFVRKFGYPDKKGVQDRLNFGGAYRAGTRVPLTKLTLVLDGYDSTDGKGGRGTIKRMDSGILLLTDDGEPAAIWNYTNLIKHWTEKHALAAFVPAAKRQHPLQYKYGPAVILGIGTDFLLFLKGMSDKFVYYDPALKITNASSAKPQFKQRHQFRVRPNRIATLYERTEKVSLVSTET